MPVSGRFLARVGLLSTLYWKTWILENHQIACQRKILQNYSGSKIFRLQNSQAPKSSVGEVLGISLRKCIKILQIRPRQEILQIIFRLQDFPAPRFSAPKFSGSKVFRLQNFPAPKFPGSKIFRLQDFPAPGLSGSKIFSWGGFRYILKEMY